MDKRKWKENIKRRYNKASKSVSKDVDELKAEYILPAVKFGKNRIISTVGGAKVGALTGLKFGAHLGLIKGAIVGAFFGAVAGPAALEKIEKWMEPKAANDDKDDKTPPEKPDDKKNGPDHNTPG